MYRLWGQGFWNSGTWNEVLPDNIKRNNRMAKVKTGVRRMSDTEVLQLVQNIVAGATGKTELANSPVTLAQLGTLSTAGSAALAAESLAVDDLAMQRTERADKFVEIRAAVDGFAQYAGVVYNHDKASLQAISLDVANPPTPPGPLPAPGNLQSFTGDLEGTIHLQWEPVPRRDVYVAECASAATGPWTQVYSGKRARTTCDNLTPGAEYFFRVRAQGGTTGTSPWSDITRKRAS